MGGPKLCLEARLLPDEMLERYCRCAVGLDESELRRFDAIDLALLSLALFVGGSFQRFDALEHVCADLGLLLQRQLDDSVMLDDCVFDVGYRHPALLATAIVVLATDAVEVFVDAAVPVLGARVVKSRDVV